MAEPVNLNRYRKQQARAAKQARAKANVVKFGRTKSDKDLDRARAEKASRELDGKQQE